MTTPDSGRHLPHHDHIAQVVTALEAADRGPGGWLLDQDPDGALTAHLDWGAGAHDLDGDPDAYDADLCVLPADSGPRTRAARCWKDTGTARRWPQ